MSIFQPKPHIVAEVPEFKFKYKDVFHLKNLYIMMHELLLEEGWLGADNDSNHADIESLYSENVYQKGIHAGGKEYWVWWRAQKGVEGRYNGYLKYTFDIDFHGAYFQDVEIIHHGKKLKVGTGEVEMFFRAKIEGDYRGTWRNHWFLKHFQEIFDKRIMSQDFEKLEKSLWRDVYRIHAKIKDYLGLRTFVPTAPPFHPVRYGHEGET